MSDSHDPINPKSKRGGYRPGAGRKPKIHPPVTIDMAAVIERAASPAPQPAQSRPDPSEPSPVIVRSAPRDEAADEAREFLREVMREQGLDPKLRIDAAKALLRGTPAAQPAGKKEQRQADALTAHEGTGWDDLLPGAMAQ